MNLDIATYEGRVSGDSFEELDVALNSQLQKLWPGDDVVTIEKFHITSNPFSSKKWCADFLVRH